MGERNRFVTLNRHIAGGPLEEAIFSLAEGPLPLPGDGEVVLRPLALSVDPYLRGQMTGIDTFYLPQFALGRPISSLGVGRVVESRHPDFAAGDVVQGVMQWADYSLWSDGDTLKGVGALGPVDPAIDKMSHALGIYGLNGMTALFGMVGVARPEPGDTVLVSGAAGGIGAVAGQIARILGARVIGLAGSQLKCDTLVRDLGFDAALNYRSATLADDLRRAMPRGPDIYFDNVGGAISQTVMAMMRRHTRVVECGQISTYDDEDGGWTVDIRPIHANGLIWESFTTAHFAEFYPGGLAQLLHWVRAGKIKVLETEHRGLDAAPRAMIGLLRGENIGKMVVTLE
ncbi:NADP-dependent oxidoreductase [Rhizorhabdus wittichii]|uniref:NADP-dependent oxidoreductase n=1 Tax=Rhizorhabdus wittichii TaxID=160791 RepID=A0A975D1K9_9SPHN|nr:NADP-dependent oxidoreductase [Rhizorhabdus wittichii]QTH21228.1 NADP-dependent oxidoreductase [Rhizorhabdus wittichii]